MYVRGLVRARVFVRIVCSYAYARMRDVLSLSLSLLQNLSHVSLKRHRLYRPEYSRLGHKGRPTSWHWARFFRNSVTICRFDAPQPSQRKQRLFTPLIPTPTQFLRYSTFNVGRARSALQSHLQELLVGTLCGAKQAFNLLSVMKGLSIFPNNRTRRLSSRL